MNQLLLGSLSAAVLALVPQAQGALAPLRVQVEQRDGQRVFSVEAQDAPLDRVLRAIAQAAEMELEGLTLAQDGTLVQVDLEQRQLNSVLEFICGSAGLRADVDQGRILLEPLGNDGSAALEQALASYVRATSRFYQRPEAPAAELSMATLEQARGRDGAALVHYQRLIESYEGSALVPTAMQRAAEILAHEERWNEAGLYWRRMAGLVPDEDLQRLSRLELARCNAMQGEAQRALTLLSALDLSHPVRNAAEQRDRDLVRAQAWNTSGEHQLALDALETIRTSELAPARELDALRELARGLQGAGYAGEAGRAWLMVAERESGDDVLDALRNAAEQALLDRDGLGALFVCRLVAQRGFAPLIDLERRARLELGIPSGIDLDQTSASDRLDLARSWLVAGRASETLNLLAPLVSRPDGLSSSERLRLVELQAQALAGTGAVDAAIERLHLTRLATRLPEELNRLDLTAAAILEDAGRLEEAIDAFEGRY